MKNLLFITVLFLSLYAQNSNATIRKIKLHAGYKTFSCESALGWKIFFDGDNIYNVAYLGDTLQFYRYYNSNIFNTTDPGILFHTIDLDITQSVSGGTPVSYSWDNRTDEIFNYVPNKLGIYYVYCDYHLPNMFIRFQVFPANTPTYTGLYIEGSKCRLVPQTTILGKIYNCACVDSLTIPVITCPSGLIDGSTCTGFIACSSCTGLVQNCSCITTTSPPTTNTGCSNGLVENSTCAGTGTCTSCTGIVQSCMCIASTTGIKSKPKIEEDGGVLYPNPADEYVVVPLRQGLKYNIYIYDDKGKELIYERVEYQKEAKIDISKLKSGNYIVQLKYCACSTPKEGCTGANKTYKFIKISK